VKVDENFEKNLVKRQRALLPHPFKFEIPKSLPFIIKLTGLCYKQTWFLFIMKHLFNMKHLFIMKPNRSGRKKHWCAKKVVSIKMGENKNLLRKVIFSLWFLRFFGC
jgi:hypothetical protein